MTETRETVWRRKPERGNNQETTDRQEDKEEGEAGAGGWLVLRSLRCLRLMFAAC